MVTRKIVARLKRTHRADRLAVEVITFEEAAWLFVGLVFGFLIAKGASPLFLLVPIFLFIGYLYEFFRAKRFGYRTVFGERAR